MTEEKEVNLDNWEPTHVPAALVCSKWRKDQNKDDFHVPPTLSDMPKIKKYIDKRVPDYQIMHSFHMDARTMTAIHENRYDAAEGIIAERPYQVKQQIERLDTKLSICAHAIVELLSLTVDKKEHKDFYRTTKIKKVIKKVLNLSGKVKKTDEDDDEE